MSVQAKSAKITLFSATLMSIAGLLATDIYIPSFPNLVAYFHTTPSHIQLSLTLFIFSFAFSQFLFPLLSDRFGRKPMLLWGIGFYLVGSLLLFDTSHLFWLYAGRLLQGFGIGAPAAICRAIVRDVYQGKKLAKAISLVGFVAVITPALSPFFGGLLETYFGFIGSFVAMLITGLVLLTVVYFCLPETSTDHSALATQPRYMISKLKTLLTHSEFIRRTFSNSALFSIVISYSLITPFILQVDYGFSPTMFGLAILVIASSLALSIFANRYAIDFIPIKKLPIIGSTLTLTVNVIAFCFALLGWINAPEIILFLFLSNIGIGMSLPNNATRVFSIFDSGTGAVAAVYGSLRMLMSAIVGALISIFAITHITNMFALLIALSLLSLFCVMKASQR